jgi:hypothetical protein
MPAFADMTGCMSARGNVVLYLTFSRVLFDFLPRCQQKGENSYL